MNAIQKLCIHAINYNNENNNDNNNKNSNNNSNNDNINDNNIIEDNNKNYTVWVDGKVD